ncbi:histidine kinase [Paractinoplanes lichenicola]|uniref:histidine kinase n=1 Tax=Paractinoplanes lichenicola TaxID=2802976 RepID=A0ABS1VYQ5_9ACTN|nr:histidine kinase [Actinoplanes lichenicola]MBL7259626.1 pentapeptide repeat-containing protein [Actinoplanes lichenicola]
MRLDLPYLAGGLLLGGLLLANAALAPDSGPVGAVGVLLIVVMAAGVAVGRRYPVPALLVVTASMLALHLRVHAGVAAAFPVLGLVYLTAWRGHRLPAALTSLVFLGGFLARDISAAPAGEAAQQLVERTSLLLGWFVAANVAGVVGRQRRAYLEQVEQRAAEAERTREEVALRRAGEERLRIARDLHDSLTHSISVIKVQAGIAVHLARKRGEEPPAALLAIQEAGGAAMRELRETLEVLRTPSDVEGIGLALVEELAERTRAAGFPVSVVVDGDPVELPAEVDQAGYRVVQEALTNVARHAGRAAAEVHIAYSSESLAVAVTDDGLASPDCPVAPGVGLRGMRERVTGLGGALQATPRDGGGFAVRATFPIAGATLDGATLDGATLDGATLDGATLDGATLDGATLDGATLDGATLDGATLDGATLDGGTLGGSAHGRIARGSTTAGGGSAGGSPEGSGALNSPAADNTADGGAASDNAAAGGAVRGGAGLSGAAGDGAG